MNWLTRIGLFLLFLMIGLHFYVNSLRENYKIEQYEGKFIITSNRIVSNKVDTMDINTGWVKNDYLYFNSRDSAEIFLLKLIK